MHGLVEETLCGVGECDEMTIDSIHAIAALCVGIVLIALSWLLPRDSGEYVRCTQCLKYRQACNSICPACLTPDSPTSSAPQYAYILATRTRGMHIQLLLAVGEFLICVAQCALPCLIIKNIVDNAGLPTAYGIDQNIKIAFVLLLVPTVACWYAFLGSGLRGEQSYSPTRPMVFRRGTPSIFKELLSGFSFAIAQPALLWFVIRPMLASMAHRHSCWKMACLCLHMASGLSAALLYSRSPAAWHLVRSAHFNVCHVEVMPSTR